MFFRTPTPNWPAVRSALQNISAKTTRGAPHDEVWQDIHTIVAEVEKAEWQELSPWSRWRVWRMLRYMPQLHEMLPSFLRTK